MNPYNIYENKTVLITGATGFTGSVLTQKLIDAGAVVHAIARSSSNTDALPSTITWHKGDISSKEFIDSVCKNIHYVFHVAAAFREEKTSLDHFRGIHVESTKHLTHACHNPEVNPEFIRFVHVSTVGVHGHIEDGIADETYRIKPGDDYQLTKYEGEQWLIDYAANNDFSYSIVRPAPIYGAGDRRLLKLFTMANKGYWIMLGKKDPYYHLIHVEDLTNIILLSGFKESANREVFIAACDESIEFSKLGKMIAAVLDRPLRIVKLPLAPFYLLADICSAVCKPFGIQPPIYRRRLSIYKNDRRFDNSKIKNILDYKIIYNNQEGIEDTAEKYLEKGWLKKH